MAKKKKFPKTKKKEHSGHGTAGCHRKDKLDTHGTAWFLSIVRLKSEKGKTISNKHKK